MVMAPVNPPGISPEQKPARPLPSLGSPEPGLGSGTSGTGTGGDAGASVGAGAIDADGVLASEAHAKEEYDGDGDEYERLLHATLMAGFMDGGDWVAEGGRLDGEEDT